MPILDPLNPSTLEYAHCYPTQSPPTLEAHRSPCRAAAQAWLPTFPHPPSHLVCLAPAGLVHALTTASGSGTCSTAQQPRVSTLRGHVVQPEYRETRVLHHHTTLSSLQARRVRARARDSSARKTCYTTACRYATRDARAFAPNVGAGHTRSGA